MPRQRKPKGTYVFELVCGLVILVPIVLYGLDYAVVLFGEDMSTSCTSAACRAAAAGPPSGYDTTNTANYPAGRASTILKRMVSPTAVVRIKSTVRVAESVKNPVPIPPYGGPVLGDVTIETRCDVFPPFNLPFVSPRVILYRRQTYPWTWVMPSGYTAVSKTEGGGGGVVGLNVPIADSDP